MAREILKAIKSVGEAVDGVVDKMQQFILETSGISTEPEPVEDRLVPLDPEQPSNDRLN